jgi:hypothetical protein
MVRTEPNPLRVVDASYQHRERHMRTKNGEAVDSTVDARYGTFCDPILLVILGAIAFTCALYALVYFNVVIL